MHQILFTLFTIIILFILLNINSNYQEHFKSPSPAPVKSSESESNTKPSESSSQPSESSTQPSESNSQPSESNSQPSESNSQPSESNSQPSESNSQPSESNSQPSESTDRPSESTDRPSESSSQPSESSSEMVPSSSKNGDNEEECEGPAPCETYEHHDEVELKQGLDSIIRSILGFKGEVKMVRRMNNLMVTVNDLDYHSLSREQKLRAENLIKDYYFNYLKKLHSISNADVYNVDLGRINVIMFPGSTHIIVEVLPKKFGLITLTEEEKELLEYHNFKRVFMKNLPPLTEYEFKKMKQIVFDRLNR